MDSFTSASFTFVDFMSILFMNSVYFYKIL